MNLKGIHKKILHWYGEHKRDLPWRERSDAYGIWLSEIMLQQTRVEAVIPYYKKFLVAFPHVNVMAAAEVDEVVRLWTGLGYYSRARNLHKCAQEVRDQYAGEFPSTYEQLVKLPGIGDYTASAIASMAGGEARIALDGNLERVLSRLLGLTSNPKREGRPTLLELGQKLASLGSAGDLNQSLMDFANGICLPKNPRCGSCPLAFDCSALAIGRVSEIPYRAPKKTKVSLLAFGRVFLAENHLLIHRRPPGAWLAGIWDLPWWLESDPRPSALPNDGKKITDCAVFRTITHHKIRFEVETHLLDDKKELNDGFRWFPLDQLSELPLPRPSEKALELALSAFERRR